MTEFEATGTLSVELDSGASRLKRNLEESLSPLSIQGQVEQHGGGVPSQRLTNGGGTRGRQRARREHRWARERTNHLEDILEAIRDLDGAGGGLLGGLGAGAAGGGLLSGGIGGLLTGGAAATAGTSLAIGGAAAAGAYGIQEGVAEFIPGGEDVVEDRRGMPEDASDVLGMALDPTGLGESLLGAGSDAVGGLLEWPDLPSLSDLSWPDMPSLSARDWPDLPELSVLDWPDFPSLTDRNWPDLPDLTPDWWPDMPSLSMDWWPDLPEPGWLDTLTDVVDASPVTGGGGGGGIDIPDPTSIATRGGGGGGGGPVADITTSVGDMVLDLDVSALDDVRDAVDQQANDLQREVDRVEGRVDDLISDIT